jgi:hypothetical protein
MKTETIKMKLLLFVLVILAIASCKKDDDFVEVSPVNPNYQSGKGVYIINEGNFNAGNGSVTFFNKEKNKIFNNIFQSVNDRPLGDIPNSMTIHGSLGFISVNNSGTIEIVRINDFVSVSTITGLSSPRYIEIIDNQKAYVTDLAEAGITIIDIDSYTVTGEIYTGKSTENILKYNNKVYVTNWSNYYVPAENNTIQVIDTETDQLIDSLVLTKEPNSMVVDKNDKLWVLCSGGYFGDEYPALFRINPDPLSVEQKFTFPDENTNPGNLSINSTGDTLYYLLNDVFQMSVEASNLPGQPIIEQGNKSFYKLSADPFSSMIYTSDAIDFQQSGYVYTYKRNGEFVKEIQAGIIPGNFCFVD